MRQPVGGFCRVLPLLVAGTSPFQSLPPGEPQFSVDVHNVDPGRDRLAEIFFGCSGTAMQCQKDAARSLDLSISNRLRASPRTMLFSMPCILPTAGASTSTPVNSTNCLASSGEVRRADNSETFRGLQNRFRYHRSLPPQQWMD